MKIMIRHCSPIVIQSALETFSMVHWPGLLNNMLFHCQNITKKQWFQANWAPDNRAPYNWALNSWAPGPNCRGPNLPLFTGRQLGRGPNLPLFSGRTFGPQTTGPRGLTVLGPICHFSRTDSWAPDNRVPGPNCPGPNLPRTETRPAISSFLI